MTFENAWLAIVGIGAIAYGSYTAWRGTRAASWPIVRGEIVDSEVEFNEAVDGDDSDTYKAMVKYRYSLKGKDYVGGRISHGLGVHWFERSAQRVADRYPAGEKVRIHVSPTDPSDAVLETGVTWASMVLILLGIAVIVASRWD